MENCEQCKKLTNNDCGQHKNINTESPIKEAILFLIKQKCENLRENPIYQEEYHYLVELLERLNQ